ncbi:EcsC family protein [Aquabacterium sp.]|uniref:EcsC family protein n=1 Tax=Aquabacterium sp. TaxID=1872578 RepID=UPI002D801D6A|nr:EcsC family protein [Aquabacterium sp.]
MLDPPADSSPAGRIAQALLDVIGRIPPTREQARSQPALAARDTANSAAARAALAAGSLALPPGALGWITLLPELLTVWKIQSQMVADIAAIYGRSATLNREQMLYCLFKHAASQAVRDLVVRAGERYLVRTASISMLKTIARRIGARWTERTLGRGLSRWLPVIGAVGVGAYAYYDTVQVAITAIDLFERDLDILPDVSAPVREGDV